MRRATTALAVAAAALALGASPALAQGSDHDHGGPPSGEPASQGRVGLLIADHGEPPEYNELTYWSFRAFFDHLIEMGLIPRELKLVDGGTVLQDRDCYGCDGPRPMGKRIDAWLRPHDGPAAAWVPGSQRLAAHYLMAGGPGLGEPDIFEHIGLQVWNEWRLMGGRSPNYDQKLAKKQAVLDWLRRRYGDSLAVRVGYGIDPRIGGGRQGIRQAVEALVRRDRVSRIVVAYHGVGFSDIMQTHMLRHEVEHEVDLLDASVAVSYAEPIGTDAAYVEAVARKAHDELHRLPAHARVAIHLSGHGLPTAKCGSYDCGADAYHAFSARLFARTRAAILERAAHHRQLGIFHVYGDGGEGDDDPEDRVDSPLEALDARARQGYTHVVDIPYEFDSDSRDTLIVLRQGYRRPIPDWDAHYESHFEHRGLAVRITNASFGEKLKTRAFERVIADALAGSGR